MIDVIDIYRILYAIATGYTFFSDAHGTFTKTDQIWGLKTSSHKFKKTEVI